MQDKDFTERDSLARRPGLLAATPLQ